MVSIESIQQLCEVISASYERRRPVYPIGGNTQPWLLRPIPEDGVTVGLTRLNALIDYPYKDLTVTVQAGMRMSELKKLLHAQRQMLPIDVPLEDQATVGGSIAANINGPRRMGWGTWRDYVLGISWINDQGQECKAGGRVVKNVAGYDFCKLFTGSLGTLGVLTQVTLKVKPMVEKRLLVRCKVKKERLAEAGEFLRYSRVRPVLAVDETCWNMMLGFEESAEAVDWQMQHLQETGNGLWMEPTTLDGDEADREVIRLTDFMNKVESVSVLAMVPPSRTGELANAGLPFQLQPAVGLAILHGPPELQGPDAKAMTYASRKMVEEMGGNATVLRCEQFWNLDLSTYGNPRPDWELMRKVKQAMDPHNIFQRGRHEIFA